MKYSIRPRYQGVLMLAGLVATSPLLAQVVTQKEKIVTLPQVKAIATESETPRVERVDREELQDAGVESWTDLGQRLSPSVNFNRQNNSVNIRGLDANRIRLTEDGVPLPWLSDGSRGVQGGLEAINFDSLSAVDIVKGPGANQTNAMTAAVALTSLSPRDLLPEGQDLGFLAKTRYSGLDDSAGGDVALAARLGEKTRMLFQYAYKKGHEIKNHGSTGGYGDGRTKEDPADYHRNSALFRLEHDLAPGHQLGLGASLFRLDRDIDKLSEQNTSTYKIGDNQYKEEIKRDRIWLDYDYRSTQEWATLDQLSMLAYWHKTDLVNEQNAYRQKDARANIIPRDPFKYGFPFGEYSRHNSVEQKGWGVNLDASGYLGDEQLRSHWMVGVGFNSDRYRQHSGGVDNCPVVSPTLPAPFGPRSCDFLHSNQADVPKVKNNDWFAYVNNTFSWGNQQYNLTPGLRYDYYERNPSVAGEFLNNSNAGLEQMGKRSGGHFSPSLAFSWNPNDTLSLFARYAHGFRAPTASELYLQYGSSSNYLRKGEASLKPETSRGWELGVAVNTETAGGSLTFFDQRYKNFIESGVPVAADSMYGQMMQNGLYPFGVFTHANLDRVRIYGLEASAYWNINNNWYTRGSVAWTVGKDRSTGDYLNSVAPLKAILSLGYQSQEWGAEAIWTMAAKRNKVKYPDASPAVAYPDFKAPGYGTLDLTAHWTPSAVKGLRIQAGLMNMFDKKYWNALNVPTAGSSRISRDIDFYTEPGRHATISISYQY